MDPVYCWRSVSVVGCLNLLSLAECKAWAPKHRHQWKHPIDKEDLDCKEGKKWVSKDAEEVRHLNEQDCLDAYSIILACK